MYCIDLGPRRSGLGWLVGGVAMVFSPIAGTSSYPADHAFEALWPCGTGGPVTLCYEVG